MGKARSKRAIVLRRVLKEINAGNYDEYDRYIVFGVSNVFDMIEDIAAGDRADHFLEDAAHKLVSDSKLHDGRTKVVDRISLGERPEFKTDALAGLSTEQRATFREILAKVLEGKLAGTDRQCMSTDSDDEDKLDAAFAEEVLGKLPKIVGRSLCLDEMSLDRVPNEDVKRYFEEAHRCYLYGFHVACAVLCRAILASALESVCDKKGTIKRSLKPKESYFEALVKKSVGDRLLKDDRPQWAIDIRDAGNDAIHEYRRFKQRWPNKLDEILLNTRKVLLDLYVRRT